jgi:hypothetical protein
MGNADQIASSEVGGNLINSAPFALSRYGNGISIQTVAELNKSQSTQSIPSTGAIEFLWKPNFGSADTITESTKFLYNFVNTGTRQTLILWDSVSTSKHFAILHTNSAGSALLSTNVNPPNAWLANDELSLRYVYDVSGIGGGADKRNLYVNGTPCTFKSGDALSTAIYSSILAGTTTIGNHASVGRGCRGVIDNYKMFDTGNIDFSGIYEEGIVRKKKRVA